MQLKRSRLRLTLVCGIATGALAVMGCFDENHLLGDQSDAGAGSKKAGSGGVGGAATAGGSGASSAADAGTGLAVGSAPEAGTGGQAGGGPVTSLDAGVGGTAPPPDASATVTSLGDKASLGWPIAIPPAEVARRLSEFLLQKQPSASLIAAIVASAPVTNQDVGELADGVLLQDGSLAGRQAFYRWWLGLDAFADSAQFPRDPVLFPALTADVRLALVNQTLSFIEDITWRPQGDFSTLLTEPTAYVSGDTATWFPGVVVPVGTSPRVALDPTRYAGIFTQPATVATTDLPNRASPTRRGLNVSARYLCQPIPASPPNFPPLVVAAGVTIRQAEEVAGNQACASACHYSIDQLGFAFGHFDAVGAYQDTENGLAIDTTGVLRNFDGSGPDAPFDGAADLASELATMPEVRACFASQWLAFATGMNSYFGELPVPAPDNYGALAADADYVVKRATIQGRLNLRGTIRAVTETHAFLDP